MANVNCFTARRPLLRYASMAGLPLEATMQKFLYQLDERDRRMTRRWRLASVGFYGSIIVGMIIYAALHGNAEVNYASAESAHHASGMASTKP